MTTKPTYRALRLTGPQVLAALRGEEVQVRVPVTRATSTVLGYDTGKDARVLWGHLYRWHLARVDGPGESIAGREDTQYLHVPAWNPLDGPAPPGDPECWYRVRPRVEPGQRFWVQEAWCLPDPTDRRTICYRASDHPVTTGEPWRPSTQMSRWASRLTLELADVRVEQVDGTWVWVGTFKRSAGSK